MLPLTATPPTQTIGQTVTLTVSNAGNAGTLVRFQVMSGPDTGFTAIIAADVSGTASTRIKGVGLGTDDTMAWLDYNNNGIVDPGEPSASVSVTWQAPPRYVVLGDSVPYGHGLANPYLYSVPGLPATAQDQGPSSGAYPSAIRQAFGLTMSIRAKECPTPRMPLAGDQLAISGAPASDTNAKDHSTTDSNCGGEPKSVEATELSASQLQANPATLVTIQAGADDIDFSDCLAYDALHVLSVPVRSLLGIRDCVSGGNVQTINGVPQLINGQLSNAVLTDLTNLKESLASIIKQVAPYAEHVAVLDYYLPISKPANFSAASTERVVNGQPQLNLICGGLAGNKVRAYADSLFIQTSLNQTIRDAVGIAEAAGVTNVSLVDIANTFDTHEMCTAKPAVFSGQWISKSRFDHDLATLFSAASRQDIKNYVWRAGHPNSSGQSDIAGIAIADLRSVLTPA
jgi:hypothetical protein